MDRQRYARVKEIFREAMRWAPEERAAVIAARAEGDAAVRDEVLSLLAHHDDAPLLREPARSDRPAANAPSPVEPPPDGGRPAGALSPGEAPLDGGRTAAAPSLAETPPDGGRAASAPSAMATPLPRARPASIGGVVERRTLAELLAAERASGAAAGWPLERVVRTLEPIARALASAAHRGSSTARSAQTTSRSSSWTGRPSPSSPASTATCTAPATSTIDSAHASSAAPEQVLPALGPTGPWTDVCALALLCVELMHGRPVTEGSAVAALARTRDDAVQPTPRAVGLEVPAAVEAVMAMAMAMRPMQRYQDVGRFWAALRDSLAASQPVPPPPSRPPSAPATSPRPSKLARRVWVLGAALTVIAVAAAAAVILQHCG